MTDSSSRARVWIACLLLFVGTLALYARVWNYPFVVYDDDDYVYANPVVCAGLSANGVRWAFTSTFAYNWHPLTWLSHMLDVELFGLDPGAHHLVNAALHAANAVLLFLALRALTGTLWQPVLVAAFFAVHPLRVESVAWIAERKDVLAGTFWMLTLWAYAHHARAPSVGRYVVVAACIALGLLAKPTVVSLPFVLLLLDVWPLGRWPSRLPSPAPTHPGSTSGKTARATSGYRLILEKLPLFGLCAAGSLVTLATQRAGGAMSASVPLDERALNALLAYATYLRQAFLPIGLAVFYPHPSIVHSESFPTFTALMAGIVLLGASVLAVSTRRRWPWLFVGWGWFVITLIPMIGLLQVGAQAHADRYTYLSLIGINIALVWAAAAWLQKRPQARIALSLACAIALLALSLATWRTLGSWKSSIDLFEHALAVTDENHVAHNNLGLALADAGRPDEALRHFEDAVRILPGFFEAQLNLGKARYQRMELENARLAFERAVQARPEHAEARFSLAVVLHRLWQLDEADLQLEQALALDAAYSADPDYRAERESLDRHLRER